MFLEDGKGSGKKAKVGSKNDLHTFSRIIDEFIHDTNSGNAYVIGTAKLSLTAGTSSVFYFKNGESATMITREIEIYSGNQGAAADLEIKVIRNPTAGTVISDATAMTVNQNLNFGSSLTLSSSTTYQGADGKTFTDGDTCYHALIQTEEAKGMKTENFLMQPGNAIGITLTTTTTLDVIVMVVLYQLDLD